MPQEIFAYFVWAVILCPLFIFSTSHYDLCAFPHSSHPLFFLFLTLNPFKNPHLHPPFPCRFAHPPPLISPLHLVTMQIYLSPLARKTGSSEATKSASAVPASSRPASTPQAKGGSRPQTKKKNPSFTLNLQKTTTSQSTAQDTSAYKSPIKSPSQYFQICY